MILELSDDATESGRQALRAFEAAGGDLLADQAIAHLDQFGEPATFLRRLAHHGHRQEFLLDAERQRIARTLEKHSALQTVYNMRRELSVIWERSTASSEQLLKHLQDWCQRAEASGIAALREFSLRLRRYELAPA